MGHATNEWIYVGVVTAILIWIGAESWRVEHTLEFAPPNAETVRVIGQQWFWSFEHADGTKEVNELHLKQNVPYRFEIVSNDVIHDFAVPDFAILLDAVPGRVNTLWNTFDKAGTYLIECREYCGMLHQNMRAKLFVEPNEGANATQSASTNGPPGVASSGVTTGTGTERVINPLATGKVTTGTGTERVISPADMNQSSQNKTGGSNKTTTTAGGASNGPSVALSIPSGASTEGNPSYDPIPLNAKKGDTITVTNNDNVPHTVTSGSGPDDPNSGKAFDTSIIDVSGNAKIDTSKLAPGDYPFHCTVHPFMKGDLKIS